MQRRALLAAAAALAAPIPTAAAGTRHIAASGVLGTLTGPGFAYSIRVTLDASALHSAIGVLDGAAHRSDAVRECLAQLLFDRGDSLAQGLIHLRYVPALGAGDQTIVLDLSDRLREIVAAARAGDVERLRAHAGTNHFVQVHGGPRGE